MKKAPWIAALVCTVAGCAAAGQPLVENGTFEKGKNGEPAGWQKPDGLGVRWEKAPQGGSGKAICLDTRRTEIEMVEQWKKTGLDEWIFPNPAKGAIAKTYGLSYYSDPFPASTGKTYRVSFDYLPPKKGAAAKVWVRGYADDPKGRRIRVYEHVVWCHNQSSGWTHFEQDFHPIRSRKNVVEMKVMLFAIVPEGDYWFDNVMVEAVGPAEALRTDYSKEFKGIDLSGNQTREKDANGKTE
jgi:hypothetical protein